MRCCPPAEVVAAAFVVVLGLLLPLAACDVAPPPPAWRSALVPADWTPSFTTADGHFVHDFSYAGYRFGETPPVVVGPVFNVTDYPLIGGTFDIQAAIDDAAAAGGGVVYLPAGRYVLDGTIRIRHDDIVLRGDGPDATFITGVTEFTAAGSSTILLDGSVSRSGDWPLAVDGESRGHTVRLQSVVGLAVGDEVVLGFTITDAFRAEHAMSRYWGFAANKWRGLFRRTITAIDAGTNTVTVDVPLRGDLPVAHGASLKKEAGYLRGVGIENLAVSNAVTDDAAFGVNRVHAITLVDVADGWVRDVHSFASGNGGAGDRHLQSGGILVQSSKRVTVTNCRMQRAQNRIGGGNGYLYEIMQSNDVLTVDCYGARGRHNFIQNWDFGTNGCVWLRCHSEDGHAYFFRGDPIGVRGDCEFHHALTMACLIDSCRIDDGWRAVNRKSESSGAGHTATECVFWNTTGRGQIRSRQWGVGHVIGTSPAIDVATSVGGAGGADTAPEDRTEGLHDGEALEPQSLYLFQRARRLAE